MSPDDPIPLLRACLPQLLSNYPVILAYLYGSTAVGQATPLSDVDIALVMDENQFVPVDRLKLELEIENQIACECNMDKLDVRISPHCNLPSKRLF